MLRGERDGEELDFCKQGRGGGRGPRHGMICAAWLEPRLPYFTCSLLYHSHTSTLHQRRLHWALCCTLCVTMCTNSDARGAHNAEKNASREPGLSINQLHRKCPTCAFGHCMKKMPLLPFLIPLHRLLQLPGAWCMYSTFWQELRWTMWAQLAVTFVNSVTCAQLPVLCILQQQQQLALMHCVQVVVIMHATKCLLTGTRRRHSHCPATCNQPRLLNIYFSLFWEIQLMHNSIPDICHFFSTYLIFGTIFLHTKVRKSRQNRIRDKMA